MSMKTPSKTNCPRCNSEQIFAVRKEVVEGEVLRYFIFCDICRYKKELYLTTKQIEQTKRFITTAKKRINNDYIKFGQPRESSVRRLNKLTERMRELRAESGIGE